MNSATLTIGLSSALNNIKLYPPRLKMALSGFFPVPPKHYYVSKPMSLGKSQAGNRFTQPIPRPLFDEATLKTKNHHA